MENNPNYFLGPSNLPNSVRKLLPYSKKFNVAARYHDIAYGRGQTERDRKKADIMFFRLMASVASTIPQVSVATTYYIIVRIGGRKHFKYKSF